MSWEGPISKGAEGSENSSDSFGIHDEGAHVILRFRVGFEVWDVVADPFLLWFVPPHLAAGGVPGFSFEVAGCAIVKDTAIRRPGPPPILVDAQSGGVTGIAAGGHIA